MRHGTTFLDHGVLAPLALPCPWSGVRDPLVVNCLSVWGSALSRADTVVDTLGYVEALLGRARPHFGAMAVEPPATVVGSGDGGAPGHESDSSDASSKGCSSCESFDLDVRIIDPPVWAGVPVVPAFRVEVGWHSVGRNRGRGA